MQSTIWDSRIKISGISNNLGFFICLHEGMVVTVHSILDSVFKKVNRNYQISRGMLLAISPGHGSLVIELILKGYVRDCAA